MFWQQERAYLAEVYPKVQEFLAKRAERIQEAVKSQPGVAQLG